MFGFFQEVKEKAARERVPAKARLEDIPVMTLREQSCKVCPRDGDASLRSPKMRPEGPQDARIYLLGDSPSQEDDEDDVHWADKPMHEVFTKFGKGFMQDAVRSNYVVQCRGDAHVAVTECCRGRIERDIEETRPLVVVTVGDAALRWATGMDGKANAPQFRGLLFVAKFGKHVCYVYPILYPNYVHKTKGRKRSQYELCVEHDIRWVKDNYDRLPEPTHYSAPYTTGIEVITGEQPGDMQRLERKLVQIARDYPRHALDLECTGLRPYMQRNPAILTAAVGTFEDTVSFPLKLSSAGGDGGWGTEAREQQAMRIFGEYLQGSGRKCAHNLAMEQEWIGHEYGYEILRRTEWDDTMAMTYALENRMGTQSLGKQTLRFFGFDVKQQSRINVKQERWWTLYRPVDILLYNGMDTKWTDRLRRAREPQLAADDAARGIYEQRIRLAPALIRMESRGLPVDFDFVRKLDVEMRESLKETEKKLLRCTEILDYERKYGRFEPTNNDMVLHLMKNHLKRPEVEREDVYGGVSFSTDEEVLSSIPRSEVPSAPLILEHREVSKLHGTYVLPALQKKWVCRDNKIRSKYGSLFVGTGRLQSEDPNAQNFPKRKHKRVRGMVAAGPGRWLVPADYGQIEFRVVGMASGDRNLVKYCWTGYDVHKVWAQRFIDVYPRIQDWVLDEFDDSRLSAIAKATKQAFDEDAWILKTLRQEAKNKWVFPQLFGSRTESCARNLHLPDDVAADLGEEFWDEFRDVKAWQEDLVRFYDKHLYVETLNGHRRRGAMSLNELINMPIQGTAAFIVQEAQCALDEMSDATGDDELSPILNVHDDLTFDIADENLEPKIEVIAREMCRPRFDWINVPLVVEVSAGSRWDNAEELRVYRSHEIFNIPNPYAEAA